MYNNSTVPYAGVPDEGTGDQNEQFTAYQELPQGDLAQLLPPQEEELLLPPQEEELLLPPQEEQLPQEEQQPTSEQQPLDNQETNGGQKVADPTKPDTWRPGDWKCSKCSEHNFASRMMCRSCGTAKDGAQESGLPDNWRPGDWKCNYCGDHQFASRMYCRQCDSPKGAPAPRDADPPKASDPNKVYCGNLNTGTTEEALREILSQFGDIRDCYILGPKGNHKGFGFVVFEKTEGATAAMSAEVELDGNKLKIEKSQSRREEGYGYGPPRREIPQADPSKLYIGKIKDGTTKEEFQEYFSQFGEVTDSVIMGDRGFGFVTFKDKAAADTALAATLELNGAQLSSQQARPKRADRFDDYSSYYRGGYGSRGRYDDYYDGYRGRGGYGNYYNDYYDYDDRYRRRSRGPPPPWARGPPRGWSPPRRRRW